MSVHDDITAILKYELQEMVKNISAKHQKNQALREHNPFNCFTDPNIKTYMGMGRSFDSQLGNRLQTIAFKIAKLDEHKILPNHVILTIIDDHLYVHTASNESTKQYICITSNPHPHPSATRVKVDEAYCNFVKSLYKIYKLKEDTLHIPVDLLYEDAHHKNRFSTFEIKAGGNLDTKNAKANYDEVTILQNLLAPLNESKSFFATCYNNMGEGSTPIGSIFSKIPTEQQLIGSHFWNKLLPPKISYEEFIEIYQKVFCIDVDVNSKLTTSTKCKKTL